MYWTDIQRISESEKGEKKKNCSKMSEGISCVKPIDKKGLGTSEKLRIIKLKPKV